MKNILIILIISFVAGGCHIELPSKPLASFIFEPSKGCQAPCEISFISTSENASALRWDFGDGTPLKEGARVSHQFENGSDYLVKLIIDGIDGGSSGVTRTVNITANPSSAPVADFSFTVSNDTIMPATVSFENLSRNADGFLWDFGDYASTPSNPNTSDALSPSHVYTAAGKYEISLTAYNGNVASAPLKRTINVRTSISQINAFNIHGDSNFPTNIAVDQSGNIYVCGTFKGTANFGNGNIRPSQSGSDDFYLAKYDGNWQCLWVYTDGSTGDDHVNDIALDDEGNVYITGFVAGQIKDESVSTKGGLDGYVMKFSSVNGARQWTKMFGGPANDEGRSLAFHRAADGPRIYLGATVIGDGVLSNVEFGDTKFTANGKDFCFSYMDTRTGEFAYSTIIGGGGPQTVEGLVVGKDGNVYLLGAFEQSFNFPSITTLLVNKGKIDIYLARWSSRTKHFEWVRSFGSTVDDFGYDIAIDGENNIYVMGMTKGIIPNLQNAGKNDENVFVGKWNSAGDLQIGQSGFNDGEPDFPGGIAILPTGNILIAGSFSGVGSFPFKSQNTSTSVGSTDLMITELDKATLTSTGNFQNAAGGRGSDRAIKVCVALQGYVYGVGSFVGDVQFNNITLSGMPNSTNTYIVRYKQ